MSYKEGDVFRWFWTDEEMNKDRRKKEWQSGTLYWCCSNICIVNESGQLYDTYWSIGGDNKRVDPNKCDLTYLGNINDYREAQRYEFDYYDDEDIMDISHSNNSRGGCYIRKDAKKSLSKAKRMVQEELDKKYSQLNSVKYSIERLTGMLEKDDVEDILI